MQPENLSLGRMQKATIWSVEQIGDVNHDGLPDVLLGQHFKPLDQARGQQALEYGYRERGANFEDQTEKVGLFNCR